MHENTLFCSVENMINKIAKDFVMYAGWGNYQIKYFFGKA